MAWRRSRAARASWTTEVPTLTSCPAVRSGPLAPSYAVNSTVGIAQFDGAFTA